MTHIFVLSGPSGSGKDTLFQGLLKKEPRIIESISATTREKRPGEEEGKHYFFMTEEAFQQAITEGKFLEYKEYAGNYYGTPKAFVEERLQQGKSIFFIIEVFGAMMIKELYPDAHFIFLLPDNPEELVRRLRNRGEPEQNIKRRVNQSIDEVRHFMFYNYLLHSKKDALQENIDEAYELVTSILDDKQIPEKFIVTDEQKKTIIEQWEQAAQTLL